MFKNIIGIFSFHDKGGKKGAKYKVDSDGVAEKITENEFNRLDRKPGQDVPVLTNLAKYISRDKRLFTREHPDD